MTPCSRNLAGTLFNDELIYMYLENAMCNGLPKDVNKAAVELITFIKYSVFILFSCDMNMYVTLVLKIKTATDISSFTYSLLCHLQTCI